MRRKGWKQRIRSGGLRAWAHQSNDFDILELPSDRGFRLVDFRDVDDDGNFLIRDFGTPEDAARSAEAQS